jgi:gamma-glutamyltranspeptidase/glutathione hydrolase
MKKSSRHLWRRDVLSVGLAMLTMLATSTGQAAPPSPATSTTAMAATAHPLATAAALQILKAGGNAADAAIAATFAISVVEPFSAGIGGGGFAMHFDAKSGAMEALDFREVAPAAATRDMYLGPDGKVVAKRATDGWLSVAVPTTTAGMAALHKRRGKLPWARLLAPAIRAAEAGFPVSEHYLEAVAWRRDALEADPEAKRIFLAPKRVGDRLVQRELAATLKAIARDPTTAQVGAIAARIDAEMQKNGGLVRAADLKAYAPTWREPLCGDYRDVTLCTMPPPSSGGVHLLQIIRLLDDGVAANTLQALGWHDEGAVHRLIESMRIAYADRAVWLGDPAFVDVPVAQLTSKAYADVRRQSILPDRARPSSEVQAGTPAQLGLPPETPVPPMRAGRDTPHTSHLTVVDADRNAVSLTFTVNYGFGSGVVVKGTGILMNDEMDDFAAAPGAPNSYGLVGGEANAVAPGKIPLSSMTPLIATKGGRFFMTAGAPGGSTIITTTLQTVLHVVDYGMDAQAAVSAPRIHQQWQPELTRIEVHGLDVGTKRGLERKGHSFKVSGRGWGNAMCIVSQPDGTLEGGADPRGDGVALGLAP